MRKTKTQNSILVLATLGVYLGLALIGAAPQVLAQQEHNVEINKRPLIDFAESLNDRIQSKQIDPTGTFSVTVQGPLTPNGRLDVSRSKVVQSSGDAKLVDIGKSGIAAISDSGWLVYLSSLGATEVAITVAQDDKNFSGKIEFDVKTPERAKTIASGLKMALSVHKTESENSPDEKLLIDNTSVVADRATVTVALLMTASSYRDMLLSRLNKTKGE